MGIISFVFFFFFPFGQALKKNTGPASFLKEMPMWNIVFFEAFVFEAMYHPSSPCSFSLLVQEWSLAAHYPVFLCRLIYPLSCGSVWGLDCDERKWQSLWYTTLLFFPKEVTDRPSMSWPQCPLEALKWRMLCVRVSISDFAMAKVINRIVFHIFSWNAKNVNMSETETLVQAQDLLMRQSELPMCQLKSWSCWLGFFLGKYSLELASEGKKKLCVCSHWDEILLDSFLVLLLFYKIWQTKNKSNATQPTLGGISFAYQPPPSHSPQQPFSWRRRQKW